MPRHGKKYREVAKLVDRERLYAPDQAVELARTTNYTAFDATIEAHLNLGVDPRHADQMVRGTVVLPHGTGKTVRVAVFAQGEKAQEALRAGADEVGSEDLVKKVEAGWLEFDVALATPDTMGMVGRLGRILGRRGLMPNPKSGTITFDIERAVREVKAGRVEFKVDKGGLIHVPAGKASFDGDALVANLASLIDAVNRARPAGAKGQYLKGLTIASTMGPGHQSRHPGPPGRCCRKLSRRSVWPQPGPATLTRRRPDGAPLDNRMTDPPQTACARGRPASHPQVSSGRRGLIRRSGSGSAARRGPGTTASTPRQEQAPSTVPVA